MKGVQFGELPLLKEDSEVVCGRFSPDGKAYATGLSDGRISLYETSGWNRMQRLKGHSDDVKVLSFSAAGDQIASRSSDSTARLWDVDIQLEGGATVAGHSTHMDYAPRKLSDMKHGDLGWTDSFYKKNYSGARAMLWGAVRDCTEIGSGD
ncbi:hypothetical protein BGX21_000517 [Mortierella sp. AD011]|nr:hypothetical protein BGX20_000723 [Mortierella sp. AD010]KAF9401813.1 hypothetical protein BGX21_000517 [Mortierella sp. AD011]